MKTLFLAVATVSIASVAVMACLFLRETRQAVAHADALILQETTELHGTSQNVNAILLQGGLAAYQAQMAAREQRAYWNKIGRESGGFLARLDHNVNDSQDGFLPKSSHALMALTLDTHDTLQGLQGATEAAHSTLDSLTLDADDLHAQLSNPAVPELLGHFNVIALHLEGVAANSEAMSGDMRLAVHRLAQPPSKLHTFLDASYTTLKFGSLFIP